MKNDGGAAWNWGYVCDQCEPEIQCGADGPYSDTDYETEELAKEAEFLENDIPYCWKPFFYQRESPMIKARGD